MICGLRQIRSRRIQGGTRLHSIQSLTLRRRESPKTDRIALSWRPCGSCGEAQPWDNSGGLRGALLVAQTGT